MNKRVVHPGLLLVHFLCNYRMNMIKTKHDRTGSLEMKIVFVRFKSASSCFLNVFLFSKQFWIQLLMHWIQVVLRLGSRLQPKWDYSKSGICLKCIKKIVRPKKLLKVLFIALKHFLQILRILFCLFCPFICYLAVSWPTLSYI